MFDLIGKIVTLVEFIKLVIALIKFIKRIIRRYTGK